MMIDTGTENGVRADQRLQTEQVLWLTTVRADAQPQSSPVWFLWDGETFLIFSQPTAQKLRNIRGNSRVSLNLNSDESGGDVVTIEGIAAIDEAGWQGVGVDAYTEKYRHGIASIGYTPESMAQEYSVALRVTPYRIRVY